MKLKRPQTRGEEIANTLSHFVGFIAGLVGFPFLVLMTRHWGTTINIVAACIYASTMLLMFLSSSLYHAVPAGRLKQALRKLDHAAIFLLIAGTYTPFTFSVLAGAWGWTLFGLIWALAATGLILMFFGRLKNPWISNGIYLLMGWLVIVAAVPLFTNISTAGAVWLIVGGLAYTGGVAFYALDGKLRYAHFVWHLFVLFGTVSHFFAVLLGCPPSLA